MEVNLISVSFTKRLGLPFSASGMQIATSLGGTGKVVQSIHTPLLHTPAHRHSLPPLARAQPSTSKPCLSGRCLRACGWCARRSRRSHPRRIVTLRAREWKGLERLSEARGCLVLCLRLVGKEFKEISPTEDTNIART